MTHDDHTELTPQEEAAFAALPRERAASAMLEERTVRGLRARGLLHGRPWYRRPSLALAGLAAAAALFLGGVTTGQWLATRTVTRSMAAAQATSALELAMAVQRAGSAYVTAVQALVQIADTSTNGAVAQGREAALTALYAAVGELVLLAPDDPVSVTLRDVLGRQWQSSGASEDTPVSKVVWF